MSGDFDTKAAADNIRSQFQELRSEVDAIKGTTKDVVTEEKHNRMAEDITAKLATIQTEQAKLRAALERPGGGTAEDVAAEHQKAFNAYLRKGTVPEFVTNGSEGLEVRAMSTQVPADGGFLVRPELATFVAGRVFESSPVRAVARVVAIGTDTLDVIVDDDEAGAGWVTETQTPPDTAAPKIGRRSIVIHELAAMPKATHKMLEDGLFDVESWLGEAVADKFGRAEASAFVKGSGVGQPRGFLSYPAWASAGAYERDKIERVKTGVSGNLGADGFVNTQGALKEPFQSRAVWMMKRVTYARALTLKGADQFFFGQTFLRDGQLSAVLLGKPVFFADDFDIGTTNGNLCAAYGDFSVGYTIADRIGIQVIRDQYSAKPNVLFYTRKRVGGDVTNFDALKIVEVGT